jgi:hypothetical protein
MQKLMSFETIRDKIRSFDAYPKTLEDFRIKTYGGATGNPFDWTLIINILINILIKFLINFFSQLNLILVTIISGLLMTVLFLSELNYYLTPELREELLVDVSRGDKLRINVDILFPHISCPCIPLSH